MLTSLQFSELWIAPRMTRSSSVEVSSRQLFLLSTNSSSERLALHGFSPSPNLQLHIVVANAVTFAFSDKSDSRLVIQIESFSSLDFSPLSQLSSSSQGES